MIKNNTSRQRNSNHRPQCYPNLYVSHIPSESTVEGLCPEGMLQEKCFRSIGKGQRGGPAVKVLPCKSKIRVDPQNPYQPSLIVHAYNPNPGEVETSKLPGLDGQFPGQ